jgi:hypothetical protein
MFGVAVDVGVMVGEYNNASAVCVALDLASAVNAAAIVWAASGPVPGPAGVGLWFWHPNTAKITTRIADMIKVFFMDPCLLKIFWQLLLLQLNSAYA